MVELRKRKAPVAAVEKPVKKLTKAKAKGSSKPAAATEGAGNATTSSSKDDAAAKQKATGAIKAGDTIDLDGFGSEIQLADGTPTTLSKLVRDSKGGVVIFTYPKANTPGCTTQACLFRDQYASLGSTGLDIYGLSADSPTANSNFKAKYSLPYPLLCDAKGSLIAAIGLKKAPSGTKRGVFVVDKAGKVLVSEAGGPAATVEAVQKLVL